MKAMTSIERETEKQLTVAESYQHPPAIVSHVYMITRSVLKGRSYYAVMGQIGKARIYVLARSSPRAH